MSSAHSYEVEVKSLLGSPERAELLRQSLLKVDPTVKLLSRNKQLNHYFIGGNLAELADATSKNLLPTTATRFLDIVKNAKDASVRTREKDGEVFLVVKASVDDTTSANGIARLEFEEAVKLSLSDLDTVVKSAGYQYQAKWSREREEYRCLGVNVTLDKNAGYGWLAEFEKIISDPSQVENAKAEIASLMQMVNVAELSQERLARMFEHYNANWQDYYGSEKIFTIE